MARLFGYPFFFVVGWLFNFVFDIHFVTGFATGWLAHTWLGGLFM